MTNTNEEILKNNTELQDEELNQVQGGAFFSKDATVSPLAAKDATVSPLAAKDATVSPLAFFNDNSNLV